MGRNNSSQRRLAVQGQKENEMEFDRYAIERTIKIAQRRM